MVRSKIECKFKSIYDIQKVEDIPYSLPPNLDTDFYIEAYTHFCKLLKDVDNERYKICYAKLCELTQ